jgi:hypothetical protein
VRYEPNFIYVLFRYISCSGSVNVQPIVPSRFETRQARTYNSQLTLKVAKQKRQSAPVPRPLTMKRTSRVNTNTTYCSLHQGQVISVVFPSLNKELAIPNAHQLGRTLAIKLSRSPTRYQKRRVQSNGSYSFTGIMADAWTVRHLRVQY